MAWVDPLAGNPRYESIKTIKRDSKGFVQLALDRSTGEQVAIKFTERGGCLLLTAAAVTATWNHRIVPNTFML